MRTKKQVNKNLSMSDPFLVWNASDGHSKGSWIVGAHGFVPLGACSVMPSVSRDETANDADLMGLGRAVICFHHYSYTGALTVRRDVIVSGGRLVAKEL